MVYSLLILFHFFNRINNLNFGQERLMMAFFSDAFLTVEMQLLAFEENFYDGAILFLLPV